MIVTWLKFTHMGTIALWSAGLFALPFLYRQRNGKEGDALHRLHAFTRYLYVGVVSPAAFVAVGSGTALIFLMGTYDNWFAAKLLAVSALTGVHIFSGLVILRLFEPGHTYPAWRFALVVPLTLLSIGAILFLVLGKPRLQWPDFLAGLFAPGGLSDLAGRVIGGTI
jgi:protoporphyrinogen IX oxidase